MRGPHPLAWAFFMSDELLDAIASNAQKPQTASVDGTSASQFSLSEQIAAHKYKSQCDALASQTGIAGIYRTITPVRD